MNNLIIYFSTVTSLLFFIFIIPGIALFPRFILNPRTSAAIPFLSISIVVAAQYLLSTQNQFNQQNVIIFIGALLLIALYRLYELFQSHTNLKSNWTKRDFNALILIIFSSIPLMVILGFDGFQHADEIYSWNLWAKNIYFNQDIKFESTGGIPYPLLLSSLIAFCYKFIGNIEYQLPIRFSFIIIYLSTIFIVFSFSNTKSKLGIFFISYIIVFLIIGVGYEYKKVWADTLMSGFLVSSLALLISLSNKHTHINKNISPISLLLASIILICGASLTKQGAMLWTILIYPLLAFVIIANNKKLINQMKLVLLVPILSPILWYFFGGSNFHSNDGVIIRSMSGRNYFDQFLFGFNESFISESRWILLLFMITVFFILFKKINFEKAIIALGIVLSTVFLIFFGAYETTRLYLHMILTGWLIIFAYGDDITTNKVGQIISLVGNNFYTYILVGLLFIYWSINSLNYRINITIPVSNYLDGREVQLNWVIGESGPEQYQDILKSGMGLWAHDNHVWGIYYGINNFRRGELKFNNLDVQNVINSLINENIGWIYEKDLAKINKINDYCNDLLTEIKTSKNMYKQTLYRVNTIKIQSCIELNK